MTTPAAGPDTEHTTTSIRDICSRRRWYTVNREYQREEDIWTGIDKKYLIDSILKGFDIPKIYLRKLPDDMYEIVDGQQRIDTIWKFRDDKITLSGEISGKEVDGKQYSDLRDAFRDVFDEYELDTVILKNYDDEKVRELFTRLQRGKPLNPAERLNAFPGSVVLIMRELGNHPFFKLVNMSLKRYHSYLIAARMLDLQYGIEQFNSFPDIGPDKLYGFFTDHKDLDYNSREFQNVKTNLEYLAQAFRSQGEQIPQLSSEVWIINLYMLIAVLRKNYAMRGKESFLVNFYKTFWGEAENLRRDEQKPVLNSISGQFILANSSGTGSRENLEIRKKEMLTNFVSQVQSLELLDTNRLFNDYEKAVIYEKGKGECAICHKQVTWKEFEADHVKPWSAGGRTVFDNAQLLCRDDNRAKGARRS
jgi:hypothetical protein